MVKNIHTETSTLSAMTFRRQCYKEKSCERSQNETAMLASIAGDLLRPYSSPALLINPVLASPSVKCVCLVITESQNVRGWKGPLWVI